MLGREQTGEDRAVCSRPSSFVLRQKVPSTGQVLPFHTSLSSAGSPHTSQKCLGLRHEDSVSGCRPPQFCDFVDEGLGQ